LKSLLELLPRVSGVSHGEARPVRCVVTSEDLDRPLSDVAKE